MKLLLLLSLVSLAVGEVLLERKVTDSNEQLAQQVSTVLQAQPDAQNVNGEEGDKKLGKRSYILGPWIHGTPTTYSHGWPWYGWDGWGGWGGHGWYGGWYPGWPWWGYSSGWHGWHKKW